MKYHITKLITPHPDDLHPMGKHLFFNGGLLSGSKVTYKYEIFAADKTTLLGIIKWFGRWRCYAFYPATNCVFEKQCLRDIAQFCEETTKWQFERARARRKRFVAPHPSSLPYEGE